MEIFCGACGHPAPQEQARLGASIVPEAFRLGRSATSSRLEAGGTTRVTTWLLRKTAAFLCRRSVEARALAEGHALAIRDRVVETVKGRLPPGSRAWLVGSLASGDFGERSDVDLVLDGVDPQLATAIEVAVCRVAQAEVDLLTYGWLSPSFRARVEQEGIAIHGQ